jgi:transposase
MTIYLVRPRRKNFSGNGELFRLCVENVLVPTLCRRDIVVMDYLGSHKSKAIRRAIRATGARLFLLPNHSPHMNLIEMLVAKLKHRLRHAAGSSPDAICNALAEILDGVSAAECKRTNSSRPDMNRPGVIPLQRRWVKASASVGVEFTRQAQVLQVDL